MSKSLKAALFSALVFPGSGHLYLKKYIPGGLLAGVSIVCLYVLVATAVAIAQDISARLQSGEIPLDVARISEEISNRAGGGGSQLASVATYLLLACWLAGIVDAYRAGRLQDRSETARAAEK